MSKGSGSDKAKTEYDYDTLGIRDRIKQRKDQLFWIASYVLQAIAYVLIVLAWASDGKHWAYVNAGGFRLGGRGYCEDANCAIQYYTEIPHAKLSSKVPNWGPSVLLWIYVLALLPAILCDIWLYVNQRRSIAPSSGKPELKRRYHRRRSKAMFILAGLFSILLTLAVVWISLADAEYSSGFWMTVPLVPAFLIPGFLETQLHSKAVAYQEKVQGIKSSTEGGRFWARLVEQVAFLWSSQFLSCLAGGFFIAVNTLIMIHDFNAVAVQNYIHNELAPMFNGDPHHANAHPTFYGDDKSCSHFPVSNITAQGRNVEPLIFFFIYHIGVCFISFFLIVDELCDVRFGILSPQQNKTGAAWTSFYLFTATMSRSIVFWSRGWVMLCNRVAWFFLAVAAWNIVHHYSISKCYGPKAKGISRGDRHAALRADETDFRGPLKVPFISAYLKKLQRAIKDGDGSLQMRSVEGGLEKKATKAREDELNAQLGWLSLTRHYPKKGGMVGKAPYDKTCVACEDGDKSCARGSNPFFRGMPYHRIDLPTDKDFKFETAEIREWYTLGIEVPLDFRRFLCMVCAFLLFIIQFALCFSELSPFARWQFRSQYANQKAQWVIQEQQKTGGDVWDVPLLPTECSYFKFSAVPVTYIGQNDLDATVLLSAAVVGLNKAFLMGMCCSIMMVSLLNQRFWGQSLPMFTLIGPRLSSISVGMTLIHVAVCTASQSLFADREYVYYICKVIVYISLIVGVLSCVFTEDFDTYENYVSTQSGKNANFGLGLYAVKRWSLDRASTKKRYKEMSEK